MDHWSRELPNSILSIKYEDVVHDIDTSVKQILDYCNLSFEQECLEFYKNKTLNENINIITYHYIIQFQLLQRDIDSQNH